MYYITLSQETQNIQHVIHLFILWPKCLYHQDEKVLFFTGLTTYQILSALLTYLSPYLPVKKSLGTLQALMLTAMRLRHNVSATFLSSSFNVLAATASKVFTDAINVTFNQMKPLIMWPERRQLKKEKERTFWEDVCCYYWLAEPEVRHDSMKLMLTRRGLSHFISRSFSQ